MSIQNNFRYELLTGIPSKEKMDILKKLYTSIFEDADLYFFEKRFQEKENLISFIAYDNKTPIGFKIGYKYNESTLYSWVGGVLQNFRNRKIATKLANLQENWAKEQHFTKIRTKSMNKFKPMLILNLKNGFDIISIYTNTKHQTKIIFEKNL